MRRDPSGDPHADGADLERLLLLLLLFFKSGVRRRYEDVYPRPRGPGAAPCPRAADAEPGRDGDERRLELLHVFPDAAYPSVALQHDDGVQYCLPRPVPGGLPAARGSRDLGRGPRGDGRGRGEQVGCGPGALAEGVYGRVLQREGDVVLQGPAFPGFGYRFLEGQGLGVRDEGVAEGGDAEDRRGRRRG